MRSTFAQPNDEGAPHFIPGVLLNRAFYSEAIRPILDSFFPRLNHSAALMGEGSDVLDFDSERSMDHNWGPRGMLFLSERNHERWARAMDETLRRELPYTFMGFPTNYTAPRRNYLVQSMDRVEHGPVNHMVKILTVRSFLQHYLGFDLRTPSVEDWVTFPQQALCEIVGGAVYFDGLGELEPLRARFAYYPEDVWVYSMMCQWTRIANELSYQARSGEQEDELGSRILATRMAEEIVRMSFLLERVYMPYSKWRGTAFARLPIAKILMPELLCATTSSDWRLRQHCLGRSYQMIAERHNTLGITRPLSTELSDFHGRGYTVLDVGPFIRELRRSIRSTKLGNMRFAIGAVDQFISHARINHENYLHRELTTIIR